MRRFIRFDHLGNSLGEVSENDIMSLVRHEEINGEHSLTVTTFQVLNKNERVLYKDGRGVWREYVVAGVDEEHASGKRVIGTYYCVWSVQPDLMGVPVSVMPGVQNPVNAGTALTSALSTQSRWAKGTVTNTSEAGASMYDTNAWNALSILVENWSGELSTTIQVANNSGVTARKVDLYSQQGDQTAKRRFDFGDDLRSVKRTFADEPYYCRISPRGKGVESGGGYGRKITIESVNSGKDYLEYSPMVDFCKLPDGNSGYQYPTLIVENSNCETPTALKTWAQSVLESYCTPKVTYEVDAIQAAAEGVDVQGVSLGDAVQIVDRYFGDGLRVSGRVVSMTVDELNEREISVTIGHVTEKLSAKISNTAQAVARMQEYMSTAEYIQDLLDRLNAEMNASGGYTYIVDGEGIWTYTCAVTDPTIGAEAKAIIQGGGSASVVNIKGGGIRIANSLTAQSEWDWRSVFTAGMIATDVLTATNITTGMIQDATHALNPNAGNYWDLDNGLIHTRAGEIGGFTLSSNALYNGPSASTSLTYGVRLGNNEIMSVGNSQTDYANFILSNITKTYSQSYMPKTIVEGGCIYFELDNTKVGEIAVKSGYGDTSQNKTGLVIGAPNILLYCNRLSAMDENHSLGNGTTGSITYYAAEGYPTVDNNSVMTFKFSEYEVSSHLGIATNVHKTNNTSVNVTIPRFSLSGTTLYIYS